jgi:hypothetical protein
LARLCVDGALDLAGPVRRVVELGGEEQLVVGDARAGQRPPHPFLVAVHGSCVDRAVAGPQSVGHDPLDVVRGDLEDAEAELRHRGADVQGDGGLTGHTHFYPVRADR